MKTFVKPVKLILGHDYEVGYSFETKVIMRLIQTTPKGYKFFNMKNNKCWRQPIIYPSKEPNHVGKGETWFFVSESLVVKEVSESNTVTEDSKMKKEPQELKVYKHQDLMKELNDMMIRIKRHLFGIQGDTIKPENEELDSLTNKLMAVLREDSEPMVKH